MADNSQDPFNKNKSLLDGLINNGDEVFEEETGNERLPKTTKVSRDAPKPPGMGKFYDKKVDKSDLSVKPYTPSGKIEPNNLGTLAEKIAIGAIPGSETYNPEFKPNVGSGEGQALGGVGKGKMKSFGLYTSDGEQVKIAGKTILSGIDGTSNRDVAAGAMRGTQNTLRGAGGMIEGAGAKTSNLGQSLQNTGQNLTQSGKTESGENKAGLDNAAKRAAGKALGGAGEKLAQAGQAMSGLGNQVRTQVARAAAQAVAAALPFITWILAIMLGIGVMLSLLILVLCKTLENPVGDNAARVVGIPEEFRKLCKGLGFTVCDGSSNSGADSVGNYGPGSGKISAKECEQIKKFLPYFQEAGKMYNIDPALLAGLASRESNVGFETKDGCQGYGDSGYGHGIMQVDSSSGAFGGGDSRRKYFPVGTPLIVKDKNGKTLIWSDCRDNIVYGAYHLNEFIGYHGKKIKSQIAAAGLTGEAATKEFWRQILNSNNHGQPCSIGSDSCTTGKDYGADTLKRAADAQNCINGTTVQDAPVAAPATSTSFNPFGSLSVEAATVGTKLTGKASFYTIADNTPANSTKTASGIPLDDNKFTAALLFSSGKTIKDIPFNSKVKVTNTANGKSVVVQITDTGGGGSGRVIDLTRAAFRAIGEESAGILNVTAEVVEAGTAVGGAGTDSSATGAATPSSSTSSSGCPCADTTQSTTAYLNDPEDGFMGFRLAFGKDAENVAFEQMLGNVMVEAQQSTESDQVIRDRVAGYFKKGEFYQVGSGPNDRTSIQNNDIQAILSGGYNINIVKYLDNLHKAGFAVATGPKSWGRGYGDHMNPSYAIDIWGLGKLSDIQSGGPIKGLKTSGIPSGLAGGVPDTPVNNGNTPDPRMRRHADVSVDPIASEMYVKAATIAKSSGAVRYMLASELWSQKGIVNEMNYDHRHHLHVSVLRGNPEYKYNDGGGGEIPSSGGGGGSSNCPNSPCPDQSTVTPATSKLDSDDQILALLGLVSVSAAGSKPQSYNGSNGLSEGHKKFLAEIASAKGYTSYPDKGGSNPGFQKAFNEMKAAASKDGITLTIQGDAGAYGYRSYNSQVGTFFSGGSVDSPITKYWYDGISATELQTVKSQYLARARWSAPPGFSEHSTGLAADINSLNTSFKNDKAYAWLKSNASKFGFTESYPVGSTKGAGYEPWHWRWDGNTQYPNPEPAGKLAGKADGSTPASANSGVPCNNTPLGGGDGKCSFPSANLSADQKRKKLVEYYNAGKWQSQAGTSDLGHILGTSRPVADQNLVNIMLIYVESGVLFKLGPSSFGGSHSSKSQHYSGQAIDVTHIGGFDETHWITASGSQQYRNTALTDQQIKIMADVTKASGLLNGKQLIGPAKLKAQGVVYMDTSDAKSNHENHLHVGINASAKPACGNTGTTPAQTPQVKAALNHTNIGNNLAFINPKNNFI